MKPKRTYLKPKRTYLEEYVEAQNAAFLERDPEKRALLIEKWVAMPKPPPAYIGWGE